jgi:hypothetical protein
MLGNEKKHPSWDLLWFYVFFEIVLVERDPMELIERVVPSFGIMLYHIAFLPWTNESGQHDRTQR